MKGGRPHPPLVPPPLARGDTVAVVAPAFALRDAASLERGIRVLERWGLVVRRGDAVTRRWGYLAGTDEERAADLQDAIEDPSVRGILAARGGWGLSRLLGKLDLAPLRRHPKVIVGYSDLTVLYAALWKKMSLACFYGPHVAELGRPSAFDAASLRRALFETGRPLRLPLDAARVLAPGRARGPLVGGCLTLLAHLCGSRLLPDSRGAVVFLEDVNEEPYRLDRLLWQLKTAGFLDGVAAVLAGPMTGCRPRPGMKSFTTGEVLSDHLASLGVPVLLDLPAGHGNGKWTIPLGFTTTVDTAAGTVTFRP